MHPIPLRRRIFLWSFVLLFFLITPIVVFYTAGYTWNQKKGVVELNGTLIVDTSPAGASITLNGAFQASKSPSTIKNLATGLYEIVLQMNGRHSWKKSLQVQSGDVTFANDVYLWLDTQPVKLIGGVYRSMRISPNGRYSAALRPQEKNISLVFTELLSKQEHTAVLSEEQSSVQGKIEWSDDSSAVLILFADGEKYLVSRRKPETAVHLPKGRFRWEQGVLIGSLEGKTYTYDPGSDTVKENPLPHNVLDISGSMEIVSTTGTTALSLIDLTRPNLRYALPAGEWRFETSPDTRVMLSNGDDWLTFDPRSEAPQTLEFPAAEPPIAFTEQHGNVSLLSWHEGELWLSFAKPVNSSDLLIRKSEEMTGAVWHLGGKNIFFSTKHDVSAIELDQRDGRIETHLAQFDDIQGIGLIRTQLYIAGTRSGEEGVWGLNVE